MNCFGLKKLVCLTNLHQFSFTYGGAVLRNGLYYKHITIINYDSSVINKFGASLTDDARVIIYDHNMFIVQATNWTRTSITDNFDEEFFFTKKVENDGC